MKTIQVYGSGCSGCDVLFRQVVNIVNELGLPILVEKIEDLDTMIAAGVMRTPALGFDGKVILQGKSPTLATLKRWIIDGKEG